MSRTPDRFPGSREETEIVVFNEADTQSGSINFVTGVFILSDSLGPYNPRTVASGTGITAQEHRALRQLVHLADGGGPFEGFEPSAFNELGPVGPFPTASIWWTSADRIARIVDESVTYNNNRTINTVQWRAFDTDGSTVLATVTDTYSYQGVFVQSVSRSIA